MTPAEKVAKWRKENPEKYKEQQVRYREKMKTHFPEELALRYRKKNYKGKYGITLEQYEEMLHQQAGVCAICGKTNGTKYLAVDHCHKTGKVRKLLCTHCNIIIEYLENNKAPISKYLGYINEFKEN